MIVTAGVFDMSSWAILLSRIHAAERELVCLFWGFGSQPAPTASLDCGSTKQLEKACLPEVLVWVLSFSAAALDIPERRILCMWVNIPYRRNYMLLTVCPESPCTCKGIQSPRHLSHLFQYSVLSFSSTKCNCDNKAE